jgi:hypothetical protein
MSSAEARPEKFRLQRLEQRLVEEPPHDRAHDETARREEQALAQLQQVLTERHPPLGVTGRT